MCPRSYKDTNTSRTAREHRSSIVNAILDQSRLTPMYLSCSTMRFPYFSFHAHARRKNPSRPTLALVKPSSRIASTTFISVAIDAWSIPGSHSVSYPFMRLNRTIASGIVTFIACPTCSCPVILGGGKTMENFFLRLPARGSKHFPSSHLR